MRIDQSLGAAHWVAQWARWKTVHVLSVQSSRGAEGREFRRGDGAPEGEGEGWWWHTLLDAVLLGALLGGLGGRHALDALLEVVLRRGALLGLLALCRRKTETSSVSIGPSAGAEPQG